MLAVRMKGEPKSECETGKRTERLQLRFARPFAVERKQSHKEDRAVHGVF